MNIWDKNEWTIFSEKEWYVYRLWAGQRMKSECVYVGMTNCVGRRIRQHRMAKEMKFEMVDWLPVADADAAYAIEAQVIREFRPRHNKTHVFRLPPGALLNTKVSHGA